MKLFVFPILLFVLGCSTVKFPVKYTSFSISPSNLESNHLSAVAGIYYKETETEQKQPYDPSITLVVLFNDGTFFSAGQALSSFIGPQRKCIEIREDIRQIPYFWGVYQVKENQILIEQVNHSRAVFEKFGKITMTGELNPDGSITILQKGYPGDKLKPINQHFIKSPCDSLPSSTNVFVTELMRSDTLK